MPAPLLTDTITLTDTIIDIADRHTTLYYLAAKPPTKPLPFHAEDAYCALHQAMTQRIEYKGVAKGPAATLLSSFRRGYANNRYWQRYMGRPAYAFPSEAWRQLLPIDAELTSRIVHVDDPHFSFRVRPDPRVRLYPFGWSTWISLRLLDPHSLSDLATFLQRLFSESIFKYENGPSTLSVRKFFEDVAQGVRADAFGGDKTRDLDTTDITVVTTVLARHGGSPALKALRTPEKDTLLRIAKPHGSPPSGPFTQRVWQLPPGTDDLEYMVHDRYGRFLWVEHLLSAKNHNHVHLRCYHNNSFVSFVHAWHLHGLLDAVTGEASVGPVTLDLAQAALGLLERPRYGCASLRQYLEEPDLKNSMKKMQAGGNNST